MGRSVVNMLPVHSLIFLWIGFLTNKPVRLPQQKAGLRPPRTQFIFKIEVASSLWCGNVLLLNRVSGPVIQISGGTLTQERVVVISLSP